MPEACSPDELRRPREAGAEAPMVIISRRGYIAKKEYQGGIMSKVDIRRSLVDEATKSHARRPLSPRMISVTSRLKTFTRTSTLEKDRELETCRPGYHKIRHSTDTGIWGGMVCRLFHKGIGLPPIPPASPPSRLFAVWTRILVISLIKRPSE